MSTTVAKCSSNQGRMSETFDSHDVLLTTIFYEYWSSSFATDNILQFAPTTKLFPAKTSVLLSIFMTTYRSVRYIKNNGVSRQSKGLMLKMSAFNFFTVTNLPYQFS